LRWAGASLLAFALCWAVVAGAQVPVPPMGAWVTDQTATLTNEQKSALEQTLRSFEARKGSQVVVLIVPSTAPETIEQYALRVAEKWKPGKAPFQMMWEAMDSGELQVSNRVPQGLLRYVPGSNGRMVLEEG